MISSIFFTTSAMAQVDCSKLDPRASLSTEKEGEIKGSVDTLYKIAKAGGSVRAKVKEDINSLQKGVPVTEQTIIKMRTLFLFCGMFANDKEISPERKVKLYKEMMEVDATDKSKTKPTAKKKKLNNFHPANVNTAIDSAEKRVAIPISPQSNVNIASHGQQGGITAQNVIINKLEDENMLAQKNEHKFATMAVNVESNIFSYYLLNDPLHQKYKIINKTPFDWRDITLATFSIWTLNHKIELDNPDSFMRTDKQYCGLIAAGDQRIIEADMLCEYCGSLDVKGKDFNERISARDSILNPFKYSEFHHKTRFDLKSFDSYMTEEKSMFMKALTIARERNPFFDFVAYILSMPETVRGGMIDIILLSGNAMTSNGPKKFISIIPIVNAWHSQTGNLSRVDDVVFYNSIIEVPFFIEVDGDKLIPRDSANIYVYEAPNISYQMKNECFLKGYKVELKHFTIENAPYKEIKSYKYTGNFLYISGTKPFGGLNTLGSDDKTHHSIQMTPVHYRGAMLPVQFTVKLDE